MKTSSNSRLYHLSTHNKQQAKLWGRWTKALSQRLAVKELRARADRGTDNEARFWLGRLYINHGNPIQGWRIFNTLWQDGYREQRFCRYLWRNAGESLMDHRVRWSLALFNWEKGVKDLVPEFIVTCLEGNRLGLLEFRAYSDQIGDSGLLVALIRQLKDHSAHNAVLHVLYRRIWSIVSAKAGMVTRDEIKALLWGVEILPTSTWQFCLNYWEKTADEELGQMLLDDFLARRERGFFNLEGLKSIAHSMVEAGKKNVGVIRLLKYLWLREFRSEQWLLALVQTLLPEEIPQDMQWLQQAALDLEMPVEEVVKLLGQAVSKGAGDPRVVVALGLWWLREENTAKQLLKMGLAESLWQLRHTLIAPKRVQLGKILANDCVANSDYIRVLKIAAECLEDDNYAIELYSLVIIAARVLGRTEEVKKYLNQAESLLPWTEVQALRLMVDGGTMALSVGDGLVSTRNLSLSQEHGEILFMLREVLAKLTAPLPMALAQQMPTPFLVQNPLVQGILAIPSELHRFISGLTQSILRGWWGHSTRINPVIEYHMATYWLTYYRWTDLADDEQFLHATISLWGTGLIQKDDTFLRFFVYAAAEIKKLAGTKWSSILELLGDYCLEQGSADAHTVFVYRELYKLNHETDSYLFYLCKSLLTMNVTDAEASGGANVIISSDVFGGPTKVSARILPGIGLVVPVRRVYGERLTCVFTYADGSTKTTEHPATELLNQEDIDIFIQTYQRFPGYWDNVINLARLAPRVKLAAELAITLLDRSLTMSVLTSESLVASKLSLAKYLLQQGELEKVLNLLEDRLIVKDFCSIQGHIPPSDLVNLSLRLSQGTAKGEEDLMAYTGAHGIAQEIWKLTDRTMGILGLKGELGWNG